MGNLVAILALLIAAPPEVTATKLDGSTISGQLQSWDDSRIVLNGPAGSSEIANADLLSLQLPKAEANDATRPFVELVDGTILPLAEFGTENKNAALKLQRPAPGETVPLTIPLARVRAVRWQSLDNAVLLQWREIRDLDRPGDLLVVLKRGGKTLDYLEGKIGEITSNEVEFTVDDSAVRVPRAKVAGLIYFRSPATTNSETRCLLMGSAGLRIPAASIRLENDDLTATTDAGLELRWPVAGITSADFSAGKLVFLSDLEPVSQKWQPLVALPAAATNATKTGMPRSDQSATGGPLTLWHPPSNDGSGVSRTETFAKGLALRSRTEVVYRLPRGYSRFLADAGIEPTVRASGNVLLTVFGDDRVLFESPIAGDEAPHPVELNVENVRRLKLVVDYGTNLDTGDWLNLCNARIVK